MSSSPGPGPKEENQPERKIEQNPNDPKYDHMKAFVFISHILEHKDLKNSFGRPEPKTITAIKAKVNEFKLRMERDEITKPEEYKQIIEDLKDTIKENRKDISSQRSEDRLRREGESVPPRHYFYAAILGSSAPDDRSSYFEKFTNNIEKFFLKAWSYEVSPMGVFARLASGVPKTEFDYFKQARYQNLQKEIKKEIAVRQGLNPPKDYKEVNDELLKIFENIKGTGKHGTAKKCVEKINELRKDNRVTEQKITEEVASLLIDKLKKSGTATNASERHIKTYDRLVRVLKGIPLNESKDVKASDLKTAPLAKPEEILGKLPPIPQKAATPAEPSISQTRMSGPGGPEGS